MELPPKAAKHTHKVRYGYYVIGRLKARKLDELAQQVEQLTHQVRDNTYALEESAGLVQQAVAQRDHFLERLEAATTNFAAALNTMQKSFPKGTRAKIFHSGTNYYTAAPLADQEKRYRELVELCESSIPDGDKMKIVRVLKKLIKRFIKATRNMGEQRGELFKSRSAKESLATAWEEGMTQVYDKLCETIDTESAESIFPKPLRIKNLEGDADSGKSGKLKNDMHQIRLARLTR